ncbi:hypothetical protein FBY35_3902 [Streptomyces sp. SLBN-118]|uniref:hypothetical protein n=1 Tax=Streptomyces sp. SLBN-118 TaxID=2768454 RepID=UPI00115308E7|nr:hypothetical protein [Streptomyces sp. SLBN-118]TQK42489.1 hypothetical protein FBY35_3902 [Streptomyces sp. SLBN-118]
MANTERGARDAIERFLGTFAKGSTRSQRRTYLSEYLIFLCSFRQCAEDCLTVDDLLDRSNIDAWMAAARSGATRRRAGHAGPRSTAAANSMAARTTTVNTFSRFCGIPLRLPRPRAQRAPRLSAVEAHRTLRLLAAHHPAQMRTETWERSVAVIALAVCTRRGLADLHTMSPRDIALDRVLPRARVAGEWYPLDSLSAGLLARWLATHRRLTTDRNECPPHDSLWVTTVPGGARNSQEHRAAGLPAGLRALQATQRKLTQHALGASLLLDQFYGSDPNNSPVHGDEAGSPPNKRAMGRGQPVAYLPHRPDKPEPRRPGDDEAAQPPGRKRERPSALMARGIGSPSHRGTTRLPAAAPMAQFRCEDEQSAKRPARTMPGGRLPIPGGTVKRSL